MTFLGRAMELLAGTEPASPRRSPLAAPSRASSRRHRLAAPPAAKRRRNEPRWVLTPFFPSWKTTGAPPGSSHAQLRGEATGGGTRGTQGSGTAGSGKGSPGGGARSPRRALLPRRWPSSAGAERCCARRYRRPFPGGWGKNGFVASLPCVLSRSGPGGLRARRGFLPPRCSAQRAGVFRFPSAKGRPQRGSAQGQLSAGLRALTATPCPVPPPLPHTLPKNLSALKNEYTKDRE